MSPPRSTPPVATSFLELILRRASEQTDEPAYTFLTAGEESDRLTFGQLDRRARALAARLQAAGAAGERALLLFPPGLDYVVAFCACLYAGTVAVPAYPPRLNRHLPRVRAIVADAAPRAALAPASVRGQLAAWGDQAPELAALDWIDTEDAEAGPGEGAGEAWRRPEIVGDSLAFLQYTSGSTSAPKGVMVSHGNLLANEASMTAALGHGRDSVIVSWLPLYHDMGLIGNVLAALYNGCQCVLMAPVDFLKKPLRWLEAMTRYRGTFSGAPDFGYALAADRIRPEERERLDLASWHAAFNGSEPVRSETLHRFAEAFEPAGFRREALFPCYGLAEYTLFASGGFKTERSVAFARDELERQRARPAGEGEHPQTLVSCGRPGLGGRVAIADPESRRPLAPGRIGEIWLAGPSVAQGYWRRPELSRKTFAARLEPNGEGPFLRTGDLGFLHGDELYVTGRFKDLIIIRGRNLHPQDLEATAEAAHPVLRPGFAAAFSVEAGGGEQLVIVAEVAREARHGLAADEVSAAVRAAVAAEHEIDLAALTLLRPNTLPKTSSGKTQRRQARRDFLAGELETMAEWRDVAVFDHRPGGPEHPAHGRSPVALADWLAERLAEALKLAPERIDLHRPLADYGLASVVAAALAGEVEDALGTPFAVDRLYAGEPSLQQIAEALAHDLGATPEPDAPAAPGAQWTQAAQAAQAAAGGRAEAPAEAAARSPAWAGPPRPGRAAAAGKGNGHRFRTRVNPELGRLLEQLAMDKVFVRGEGCWLWDRDGERYLDFLAQYGALPFGFNPPEIWAALDGVRESGEPSLVQPSALDAAGELAERLIALAPPGLAYVTFANSGAEAVEAAIKLARSTTGRHGVLAARGGFHGKTLGALSATPKAKYQRPFGAPVPGFAYVEYGDAEGLAEELAGRRYAAFLVEPIQGEGGIVEPPAGYLRAAREACTATGTLLVADEVQTGLGRTGALFACTEEGVTPDLMTLAKALGGGLMPIGACLATTAAYNQQFGLHHSSTFAGNALACRAGIAALDLLVRDGGALIRRVAENGDRLKGGLERLRRLYPHLIREVRGRGYLLGVRFGLDRRSVEGGLLGYLGEQDVLTALVVSHMLNRERVRAGYTLSHSGVMRVEPPLVAGWAECQAFLDAFERVLARLDAGDLAELTAHVTGHRVAPAAGGGPVRGETVRGETVPPRTVRDKREPTAGADERARRAAAAAPHRPRPVPRPEDGRFAFLVHPLSLSDYRELDATLGPLSQRELRRLSAAIADNFDPFVIGETYLESATGRRAYGEFVLLPRSAAELRAMKPAESLAEVRMAAEIARDRGARIIGLGAYTSVVTQGGLALQGSGLPALTTGNSFTAAAARRAIDLALAERGWQPERITAVVLGAGGAIGQAVATLLAPRVGRLVLIGNPMHPDASQRRLHTVAARILGALASDDGGDASDDGPLAAAARAAGLLPLSADGFGAGSGRLGQSFARECPDVLEIGVDASRWLPEAGVVVTATSSVERLVHAEALRRDAVVCDVSTPSNVGPELRRERPDVLIVDGGVVRLPEGFSLGFNAPLRQGMAYACMAETMCLALEQRYRDTSLGFDLPLDGIAEIERLALAHGFEVVLEPSTRVDETTREITSDITGDITAEVAGEITAEVAAEVATVADARRAS